jgi:hypothetical protein
VPQLSNSKPNEAKCFDSRNLFFLIGKSKNKNDFTNNKKLRNLMKGHCMRRASKQPDTQMVQTKGKQAACLFIITIVVTIIFVC